jgi:hypothetical protein
MCIDLTSCVYDPIVSDWMERNQEMMPSYALHPRRKDNCEPNDQLYALVKPY